MWWSMKCPNLQLTESEPRDAACIPFIEILGGALQAPTPLLGGDQMATLGAAICNALCERWSGLAPVTKPHAGLTTVARQPGWGKRLALMNHDTSISDSDSNISKIYINV